MQKILSVTFFLPTACFWFKFKRGVMPYQLHQTYHNFKRAKKQFQTQHEAQPFPCKDSLQSSLSFRTSSTVPMVTSCNSAMKRKLTSTRHITLQQRVLLAVALTTTVREQPSKATEAGRDSETVTGCRWHHDGRSCKPPIFENSYGRRGPRLSDRYSEQCRHKSTPNLYTLSQNSFLPPFSSNLWN